LAKFGDAGCYAVDVEVLSHSFSSFEESLA
jgi:hypothetical protein